MKKSFVEKLECRVHLTLLTFSWELLLLEFYKPILVMYHNRTFALENSFYPLRVIRSLIGSWGDL